VARFAPGSTPIFSTERGEVKRGIKKKARTNRKGRFIDLEKATDNRVTAMDN